MATKFPSADDVALAICLAAIEFAEDPIECARGVPEMICRRAAMCALEIVFPQADKFALARTVGYDRDGRRYARDFNGRQRSEREQTRRIQWQIAEQLIDQVKTRDPDFERTIPITNAKSLTLHRPTITPDRMTNVTASLMGDPPPQRSALADKLAHVEISEDM